MDDLIRALLLIRSRMADVPYAPTHCEHDQLTVVGADPDLYTSAEIAQLDELGFFVSEEYGDKVFMSFRFGSA